MRRILARAGRVAAALVAVALPLAAQTSQTAGAIRGRVATPAGAPIADVTVTATSTETGLRRVATTDASGNYTVRLLPSGVYRIDARRLGYARGEVLEVRVVVGATATANVVLRDAAQQLTTVTIGADRPRIDVANGGVQTTVTTEEIQNLPALGRDFTDFIALSGLVSPAPEATTGGQFSIAGARPSETNIQVDGVDGNNAFFGGNRGGARIPFNFSLESVKEFQVVTNGFDVEYGNYSGGVVNILTRGGTNKRTATFYSNFRGEQLTGNNFDGTAPRNFEAFQYAGAFTGPLVKDRLFYSVSVDGQRRREPFTPRSAALFRQRAAQFPDSAVRFNAFADSLERFTSILQNTYGIADAATTFSPFETSNDVLTVLARLDWNISDRHRLSVRNNFTRFDNLNEAGNVVIEGGSSRAEAFRNRNNSLVAELTSQVGERANNVFRVQWARERQPRVGNDLRPTLVVNNVSTGLGGGSFGGSGISFRNNLQEDKLQIIDNFTVQAGRHNLKLGTNLIFSRFANIFWNGGSGTWTFASLGDLEAQRPLSFTRNLRADGQAPAAFFDQQELGFYVQDDWQLSRKLLVQAGLRYDINRFLNAPSRVQDVERLLGFGTGREPIDRNNVSPRLAATYDVRGDGREVIRAGGGLFYGRFPAVLGSNVGITDVPLLNLNCSGSFVEQAPNAAPSPAAYRTLAADGSGNPTNCLGGPSVGGIPTYTFWGEGFRLPETFKANVGYERLLGESIRLSADLVWTSSNYLYTVRNLNLRDPVFELPGEGGRRVFSPQATFNPANGPNNFAESRRYTQFGDLYVNYTDGLFRSAAATFNAEKRFRRGGLLRASYTYTNANDNSSYNCCTANEGFTDPRIGVFGPNEIGGVNDRARGWGATRWVRNHAIVVSGFVKAPWGFTVSAFWRMQSGLPWGPEQAQDINGDGVNFNDRLFIFSPENLPVFVASTVTNPVTRDSIVTANRTRYRDYLNQNECVRSFVGRIVDRHSCREDWFNRLDMSIRKDLPIGGGRAQLSIDLFNVLNGLNSAWGRFEGVRGASRNLLQPQAYNAATNQVEYTVPTTFGREGTIGTNLLLQFSTQVGIRYSW